MYCSYKSHDVFPRQVEMIELLIRHGSNVNIQVQDGFSSLHIAAQNGDECVVDMLLRAGAQVGLDVLCASL